MSARPHPDVSLASIDLDALAAVTGGGSSGRGTAAHGVATAAREIDGLLDQLHSITSSIKDINHKTSGLSSSEMMMLCVLAMQNRAPASVVYVSNRRGW